MCEETVHVYNIITDFVYNGLYFYPIVANLIDFNINKLAAMIVCVHIMVVIIFQNMVTGIYLLIRHMCILCLLSGIGGRGKVSKRTRCFEGVYFTTLGFLQGAYITAVT